MSATASRENVQGRCRRTVERQTAEELVFQTGVRARLAQPNGPAKHDWLQAKDHRSRMDMLITLRAALWDE